MADDDAVPAEAVDRALAALNKHGAPGAAQHHLLYLRLARELLHRPSGECEGEAYVQSVRAMRNVLHQVTSKGAAKGSRAAAVHDRDVGEALDRCLLVCHYLALRHVCREAGVPDMVASLASALLRFCGDLLPPDRAFFEAGLACREQGWMSQAFVMLNHYHCISFLHESTK